MLQQNRRPLAVPRQPRSASKLDISSKARWLGGTAAALLVWVLLYSQLVPFSEWAASLLPQERHSPAGEALAFFLYEAPKVLLLLTLVVFAHGRGAQLFFRRADARNACRTDGKVSATCWPPRLGIVTPFCSCSAVPLFIGFVSAGVPLGVTFSFLISAPMVNEVALGLLFGLLGWKVALTYLAFGLGVAIAAGWVIGRLHLEHWLQDWVRNVRAGAAEVPAANSSIW